MSSFMFYQEGPSIRTAVRVCVSESELGLEERDMRSNKFIEYVGFFLLIAQNSWKLKRPINLVQLNETTIIVAFSQPFSTD